MSKMSDTNDGYEEDYDFSKGVRGKYIDRLKDGSNVIVLDPAVASELESPQAGISRKEGR